MPACTYEGCDGQEIVMVPNRPDDGLPWCVERGHARVALEGARQALVGYQAALLEAERQYGLEVGRIDQREGR